MYNAVNSGNFINAPDSAPGMIAGKDSRYAIFRAQGLARRTRTVWKELNIGCPLTDIG